MSIKVIQNKDGLFEKIELVEVELEDGTLVNAVKERKPFDEQAQTQLVVDIEFKQSEINNKQIDKQKLIDAFDEDLAKLQVELDNLLATKTGVETLQANQVEAIQ